MATCGSSGANSRSATDTVQALVTQLTGSASADEARKAVAAAAKE